MMMMMMMMLTLTSVAMGTFYDALSSIYVDTFCIDQQVCEPNQGLL